jgi:hypothetical protein
MRTHVRYLLAVAGILALACATPAAARVVVITIDQTSTEFGLRRVPAALAPDGNAALALVACRTAHSGELRPVEEGYLSINAGMTCKVDRPLPADAAGQRAWWEEARAANPGAGALGDALHGSGLRTGACGSAYGALLLADHEGNVDTVDARPLRPTAREATRVLSLLARTDVAVIDLRSDQETMLPWLAALLRKIDPATTVLICSPNPMRDPQIAWPPTWAVRLSSPGPTALYSPSTHRAGLVANTDLGAGIAAEAGVDRPVGIGKPYLRKGETTAADLLSLEGALRIRHLLRPPVFLRYIIILSLAMVALAAIVLWGGRRAGRIWPAIARALAVAIAASWVVAAVTGLWPTSPAHLLMEAGLGLTLAAVIVLVCRREKVAALWIAAGAVSLIAFYANPNWTLFNQVSYLVLSLSRYYGLGNPGAGMIAAAALAGAALGVGGKAPWRQATLALPWLAAGWIFWGGGGANFGMGIATAAMATAIVVAQADGKKRVSVLIACGIGAVVLLAGLVMVDRLSGEQSHIARLLARVQQEGGAPLWEAMLRKGHMALRLLTHSSWTYLLLASLAVLLAGGAGRRREPDDPRTTVLMWGGLACIGFSMLLNDSGVEPAGLLAACVATIAVDLRRR